ncbi:hypothetical protein HHI36_003237 [Cryptolaemus montrouzieri]|uniref:Uncharacterized protein n=1 Tax=Cryptolaemus montrouzieri TaxID=559131 RepID=A0ABD2PDD3_9CUCU
MKSIKPKPFYLFLLTVLQFSNKPVIAMVMVRGSGSISTTETSCDQDKCQILCKKIQPEATAVCSSTHIGLCDCRFNIPCLKCNLGCKVAGMDGECDKDRGCRCSVKPEVCPLGDCTKPCKDDLAGKTCLSTPPVSCMKYGPIKVCNCFCS